MTPSVNEYRLLKEDNIKALDQLIAEKINFQLIYMDPPYNTGRQRGARKSYGDSNNVGWEDSMRQVIKRAHSLLKDSGFLAISINQMELFHLKSIIDETFEGKSFVGIFPVKIRHKDRQLMINATFHDLFEYLLIYRKNSKTRFFTEHKSARVDKFVYSIKTLTTPNEVRTINDKKVEIYLPDQYQIVESGFSSDSLRRYIIAGKLATANWSGEWYESHLRNLGDNLLIKVDGLEKEGLGYRWFQTGNDKRKSGVYFQSQITAGRPILPTNDLDYTEIVPTIFKEGGPGCDFKDSKKPEALLSFIMKICTQEGDSVLDPFAGSGTTLAVAIKEKRSAIVIDNDDSSLSIIKSRLKNLQMGKDIDGVIYNFSYKEG